MNILGIDIGGSTIKAAPVDPVDGVLVAERRQVTTPKPATPATITQAILEIIAHFNWQGPIGCGLPAVVRDGIVCTATNISAEWIGHAFAETLSQKTARRVTVLNDADAAGLAEMNYGAGQGMTGTTLVVTAGTGLGTALFRDKTLVPNTELGHLYLHGQIAESFASAAVRTSLNLSYGDWAKRFDDYLHRLEELFWPDLFIIGGAISADHAQFLPLLTTRTRVLPAVLRNDAGIIGAAAAVLR